MNLRAKLVALTLSCIVLIAVSMSLVSYLQMRTSVSAVDDMNNGFVKVLLIQDLQSSFKTQIQEWKNVLIRGADPAARDRYFSSFTKKRDNIESTSRVLEKLLSADEKEMLTEFLKAEAELVTNYSQAKIHHLDGINFDMKAADHAVKGMDRKVLDPLDKLTETLSNSSKVASAQSQKTIQSYFQTGLLASGLVSLIAALATWFFAHRLAKTLETVNQGLNDSGNYVASTSSIMSTSSQQLSSASVEAASSLEETLASLEEIASMIERNSKNAHDSGLLSKKSQDVAVRGEQEVQRLISEMKAISEGSRRIEEITSVIDDIAFQTNLLALNAAVEAARAGEQGKSFSVVADAVRALAQKSAVAAKDINDLIKDNVERIAAGAEIADQSGLVLKEIVENVTRVAEINSEIASASREQTQGIQQISKAMTQLDEASQLNAASAEETAASSAEMSTQAQQLKNYVETLTVLIDGKAS